MSKVAATMPEAKHRSTKKRVQPVRSTPSAKSNAPVAGIALVVPAAMADPAAITVAVPAVVSSAPVKEKKASRKPGEAIASWWPVAVAIFLSGFAPEWHAMASQAGIWALRAMFPLAVLATHREIGIDDQMATVLPQLAIYLQLPLEGLLTKITLDRGKSLKAAIAQLILIHAVATFVLWLVTFSGK